MRGKSKCLLPSFTGRLWEASYSPHVSEDQGKVEDLETPHLDASIA